MLYRVPELPVGLLPYSVISRNLKLGGYRQMFGGCKHAKSANIHSKNSKSEKITLRVGDGVVSTLGGQGGCKNITATVGYA